MLEPCVTNTQVMIPAKIIELVMIVILVKILVSIGNAVGSEQVGTACSPLPRTRVCVHKYDLCVQSISLWSGRASEKVA